MEPRQEMFAAKLHALEETYGQLLDCIRQGGPRDRRQLHRTLDRLWDACWAQDAWLAEQARSGRLASGAALARAQLEYGVQAEQHRLELERDMRGRNATAREDEAEAAALYAEYAIDFACQSTRWALAAALRAMELQAWAEEPPPGNENGKEKE